MKSRIRAGCRRLLPGLLLLCLTLSGCTVQTTEAPSGWILTQEETYEKAEAA